MNFNDVKLCYIFFCISLSLIILSPTFFAVFSLPEGEQLSEMWLFGPNHMMEGYPVSVSSGVNYSIFIGVGNHMGCAEYYLIKAKIRNQSDPEPDRSAGNPVSLPVVYEYRLFLQKNATWENEFSFTLGDFDFKNDVSKLSTILINGELINVDKIALLDKEDNNFYYELLFELWIFNSTISDFQFANLFVGFWMKLNEQI